MKHVKTIALATGATLAATAAAAATYTLPAPGARQNALVSQAVPPAAAAAQAPATTTQAPGEVTITARDQPIAAFLRDLFGRVGRPVVPSPSLTGTVNGLFRGSVNKIYGDVAKAFNLVSYDDGAALYVYGANELRVVTLQVGPAAAQRASRLAAAQRLTDRRNYIRTAADGALVVSGTPRFIEQVTALARDGGDAVAGAPGRLPSYGAPLNVAPAVQPLEFRVFYLRYARAEDTVTVAGGREQRLPGIATILQNLVLDQRPGGSASSGPQIGSRPVRQSQPRLKGTGLDAIVPGIEQTPSYGLPSPGVYPSETLGIGGGGSSDLVAPLTADVVRIEANPYLNAIIVRDVPERMAAYDSLIRALDVEPQVVEVEATIIDINVDRLQRLGINWRFGSGGFGFLFGDGTANDLRLNPVPGSSRRDNTTNIVPQNSTSIVDTNSQGGTLSTIIGSDREFLGRIQALETKGVARVVTRPQVMTLSNVEAVFDRTRTFYVRVGGIAQVDLFNVTAGTILRVNPHVFRDHDQTRIRMLVNIEDGAISPTSMVENIPVVERSSVATQAMVTNGESLLLGGMTVDADYENLYKVPLLGDIPLLGNLFKVRQKNKQRIERLFLITPRLVPLGSRVGPIVTSSTTVRPGPIAPNTGVGTLTPMAATTTTTGSSKR
jgi:type III secretion protein C